MIAIQAKMELIEGKKSSFLENVQELVEQSRNESGNVSYSLYQHTENENGFIMIEEWQDEAAIEIHNQSEHFTKFVQFAQTVLAKPLDVKKFEI